MSNERPKKAAKSGTKSESQRRKKVKILIIDDEADFVEACRRTLEAKAYQVV